MTIFHLPVACTTSSTASIVHWHVRAGDDVRTGQRLLSLQTATALVDITSPQAGRIAALLAAEGDVLSAQAPLLSFADAVTDSSGAATPQGPGIGRHRHTEARLQQSAQRRHSRR